jgi:myo-inositol-1(or 4)-monophosphatase
MMNEKNILLHAVQEAGKAIVSLQSSGFSVTRKVNNDLLTQADLLANDILKHHLQKAFPAYGWLSEENVDDASRLTCERVWIVDPIDGTKEYAQGVSEYAISVALVEDGSPILSCVFNPAVDELFYAVKSEGAWLQNKKIFCNKSTADKLVLLASRSEYARGEWTRFQSDYEIKQVGSIAYKLALVAAGQAHATFSLGPKNEWDIAAGVLLVTEAGGLVTDQKGNIFRFNQENVTVNGIVANSSDVDEQIFKIIRDI